MNLAPRALKCLSGARSPLVICLAVFTIWAFVGCGARSGLDPEHSTPALTGGKAAGRRLAVPLFTNATFEPILDKQLTQVFKKTLYSRGWEILKDSESSEWTLLGRVTQFGRSPLSLDPVGAAKEYRVQIHVTLRLLRRNGGAALFSQTVEGSADYIARPDALGDRIAKDRAIREAARNMAEEAALLLQLALDSREMGAIE
ncbi:MAG: LPS assembly lipoprotein LptE [Nitrospiria bacterium]